MSQIKLLITILEASLPSPTPYSFSSFLCIGSLMFSYSVVEVSSNTPFLLSCKWTTDQWNITAIVSAVKYRILSFFQKNTYFNRISCTSKSVLGELQGLGICIQETSPPISTVERRAHNSQNPRDTAQVISGQGIEDGADAQGNQSKLQVSEEKRERRGKLL